MTVDDWMDYLTGQLLRERWAGRLKEIVAAHPISYAEIAEVIRSHAVCAGRLDEWAVRLAGRAAVAARSGRLWVGEPATSGSARPGHRIETEYEEQRRQTITPKLEARSPITESTGFASIAATSGFPKNVSAAKPRFALGGRLSWTNSRMTPKGSFNNGILSG
jgi:hypothetical protein